jgi:hypothetical protein
MATTFNNFEFNVKPENHQVVKYKQIINEYLSKEEIKKLHQKSDWKGFMKLLRFGYGLHFLLHWLLLFHINFQ